MQAQAELPKELLWQELAKDLKQFIARRIRNLADVEDVLQEALYKIQRSIGCLSNDKNLYAWMYRITRNTIVDFDRKQEPTVSLDTADGLPDDFIQSEPTRDALGEIAVCLTPMLNHLPEPYREALVLTDIEGMTQAELAKHLGISLSGAKSRVQRAREQLKALIYECCQFEYDHLGNVVDYECKKPYRC